MSNDSSRKRPAFAVVPTQVFDYDLRPTTFRVLVALYGYAASDGSTWVGNERLGEVLGLDQRHVRRAVADLVTLGLARRIPRYDDQGRQTSSTTVLTLIPRLPGEGGETNPPGRRAKPAPHEEGETSPPNTPEEHTTTPPSPSLVLLPPPNGAGVDRFDEWWGLYPKKVGKGQARRAFKTACNKSGPDLLIAALARQQAWLARRKEEGFCPDPATWLNGERWLDEGPGRRVR